MVEKVYDLFFHGKAFTNNNFILMEKIRVLISIFKMKNAESLLLERALLCVGVIHLLCSVKTIYKEIKRRYCCTRMCPFGIHL